MTVKVKFSKRIIALFVALTVICITLIGSFAWANFNQTARNLLPGNVIPLKPDVNLHDDFWEYVDTNDNGTGDHNKDIYVENSGEETIYVRVSFREFLEIGGITSHGANYKDSTTWETHRLGSVDSCYKDFHNYYTWIMGNTAQDPNNGWKWYIPAPDSLKGVYDEDGNYTTESKTVYGIEYDLDENGDRIVKDTQRSIYNKTYAEIEALMLVDTGYQTLKNNYDTDPVTYRSQMESTLWTKWGVKLTETTESVTTMADWIADGAKPGKHWVMDTTGWFYWAEGLKAGEATGLLLSEVLLKNTPNKDWLYAIDVHLNAVTADDFVQLKELTTDAARLLYTITGDYIGGDNNSVYKTFGQNVYQQGSVSIGGNGSVNWNAGNMFAAGELDNDGSLIPANFIIPNGLNSSFNLDSNGDISFVGDGEYNIYSIEKGVDGLYYFNLGDGVYARALSTSEDGTGMLGTGEHQLYWVPQGSVLGDKNNLTENPWFETKWNDGGGEAVFYWLGEGVYYRVTGYGSREPYAGNTTLYVSAKDRATIEAVNNEDSFKNTFIYVGGYYNKLVGGDYKATPSSVELKRDGSGDFKINGIVKSPENGKYYIEVMDGRLKYGTSDPQYAYYAAGADGILGSADDIKTWAGSKGIGSSDDSKTPPSQMPSNLAVGKTFNQLGKYWQNYTDDQVAPSEFIQWDVLAIDGTKALVITHDIIDAIEFGSSETETWPDSSIRQWLNTTFVEIAFKDGSGFNNGSAKQQIVLTEVTTGTYGSNVPNPGDNYLDGYKTLDYIFLLDVDQYSTLFKTDAARMAVFTQYAINKGMLEANVWTRNRSNTSGKIRLINGTNGTTNTVSSSPTAVKGVRPAMWIEFDAAKWGNYGSPGTGGNWTITNSNSGKYETWYPGKQ